MSPFDRELLGDDAGRGRAESFDGSEYYRATQPCDLDRVEDRLP
jgi:hypothetical protein